VRQPGSRHVGQQALDTSEQLCTIIDCLICSFPNWSLSKKPPDGCRQVLVGYFLPGDAAFLSRARDGGGYQAGTGYHSPMELKCADITGKSGANEQAIKLF
jgi:hypothetical protein